MPKKELPRKNLLLIILTFIIIGGIVYYVFFTPVNPLLITETITSSNVNKYEIVLKRLERIMGSYQSTIFTDPNILSKFSSLKPFITLPLQIGLVGKENPFEPPTVPAELLLQQTQITE